MGEKSKAIGVVFSKIGKFWKKHKEEIKLAAEAGVKAGSKISEKRAEKKARKQAEREAAEALRVEKEKNDFEKLSAELVDIRKEIEEISNDLDETNNAVGILENNTKTQIKELGEKLVQQEEKYNTLKKYFLWVGVGEGVGIILAIILAIVL